MKKLVCSACGEKYESVGFGLQYSSEGKAYIKCKNNDGFAMEVEEVKEVKEVKKPATSKTTAKKAAKE